MSGSSASLSVKDYIASRGLDVIKEDTDLNYHQFVIESIMWQRRSNGDIPKSQKVIVTYANSFVLTGKVLNKVTHQRWEGERQVRKVITRKCADGNVYEIYWKTFGLKLWELLPPYGYSYELVANFLMREQQRRDAEELDDSGDSDDSDDDEEEDDDEQTDLEPVNVDAVLAAPAATAPVGPDLSCAPSAAPAAESDDSNSAEHVNKKIKTTHESSTEQSAGDESEVHFA